MKKILKIISFLFILLSFFSLNDSFASWWGSSVSNPYSWENYWLDEWINEVKGGIEDIEKNKKLSEYVQDIVIYVIWFVTLISVLYIIYAWFVLLIWVGDEEKAKKTKWIISYVIIWIVLIWLAYPLTTFIIGIFS